MSGRHRRERLPPHVQDQFRAAQRDITDTIKRLSTARHGGRMYEAVIGEGTPEELVASRVIGLLDGGHFLHCQHIDDNPQPAAVRAWDNPLVVRCQICALSAPGSPSPDEDFRCDLCGQVERDQRRFLAGQTQLGAMILSWGLCGRCSAGSPVPMPGE